MEVHTFSASIQKSLEDIIKKEGYVNYNVNIQKFNSNGDGYMGVNYVVDVKGKTEKGDKETNIFLKIAICDNHLGSVASLSNMYLRECFFYTEISKVYEKMQAKAGIPVDERYKVVKGYDESNSQAIFLENAEKSGYKTYNRMEIPSIQFLEHSIRQLAKLHGLSFALATQSPDYFNKKVRTVKFTFNFNDSWYASFKNMASLTTQHLDDKTKKRVDDFIPTALEKRKQCMGEITTISCLCHGDYRMMNILKKEVNGEVTDVIPIDYQGMHFGCPLNDFFFLIFACLNREMRKKYLHYLKNLYYDTLGSFLKYFNVNVEDVFPRKEYEKYYENRKDLIVAYSILFFGLIFAPETNLPDISKGSLQHVQYTLDVGIQERITELVEEYIELGVL